MLKKMKSITKNKKAYFEYNILEKNTAGIQLQGSEVKSIRAGKVSVSEAYCYILDGEIFIKGMHIAEYTEGGKHYNHKPLRDKKLLMKKKEIAKLDKSLGEKGLTIVPLEVIITDTGLIKLEIGLAKGKHLYDKRQSIKEKDIKRDMERTL
jgi:SsrA-binding protein